ncbi:MAG: alanine racemase [Proteobacteria bacterium SW_6_67_9]|nr:MAG: alanine racemase [Proteobacteria bacterium SW_6_67_9]
MLREAIAELDARALRANLARAREHAPASALFASIKAAGYGHGLVWTAQQLGTGCEGFAVATVGEGVALRDAGLREHRICVLNGGADHDDLAACAAHALEPVVHQHWQLQALASSPFERRLRVWLKVDTGMGRLGVPPEQARSYHQRLSACAAIAPPVGVMTHLANAADRASDFTERQLAVFQRAVADLAGPRSIANSAGVMGWPATHADWNRPGIMLYGCSPFGWSPIAETALDPVMRLTTRLIAVNELDAGAPVGYGCTYVCPERMRVGVAAIGYGDGYPRHAPSGTPALVRGTRVPMAGRVSMDKITLDLRGVPEAQAGDRVELWGPGVAVEEVAAWADTIGYELLAGVHGRVPLRTLSC